MFEATYDTSKNYEIFEQMIEEYNLSGIDILDFFTNYHGLQLLTEDCTQDFIDEFE